MTTQIELELSSPAFESGGSIPSIYTCEGKDINFPISIKNIPVETKSMALIMQDPDAPKGIFDHWICWNIPPEDTIRENSNPGINGTNGFGKTGYGGPCPPTGSHRYFVNIYALDCELKLEPGAGKQQLIDAMKDHLLATGEMIGLYKKVGKQVTG